MSPLIQWVSIEQPASDKPLVQQSPYGCNLFLAPSFRDFVDLLRKTGSLGAVDDVCRRRVQESMESRADTGDSASEIGSESETGSSSG